MPTVYVITRPCKGCKYENDLTSRRCACQKQIRYNVDGREVRKSAKTSSWDAANKKARELETALNSGKKPEDAAKPTIKEAIALYLAAKRVEGIKEKSCDKLVLLFEKRLMDYCTGRDLFYLADLGVTELILWMDKCWPKYAPGTARKMRGRLIGFFDFLIAAGKRSDNPPRVRRRSSRDGLMSSA